MSDINLLPSNFSHIYVEEKAFDYEMTSSILSHFNKSAVVKIRHYKDVFNRPGQDAALQDVSKNLILAVNSGKKIFAASSMCQDFGMGNFYYAESAMNCVFSCDYCFLKGMYPSSNIVIFVNSDDYIKECEDMLEQGPVYLCASFDTDIAALSGFCPWKEIWERLALKHPELTIEMRTKAVIKDVVSAENIIYAFTLSPDEVISEFEKKTPSLSSRFESVNCVMEKNGVVRLCFDPLIYVRNFDVCYNDFIDKTLKSIDFTRVRDVSIGTFRISSDYLSGLRKANPGSSVVLFPFDREDGFCVYPSKLRMRLIGIIKDKLEKAGYGSKLYIMS